MISTFCYNLQPPPPTTLHMNGHKHSHSSQRDGGAPEGGGRRPSQFNTARTAWLLSILLMLTIITQFILIAYHEEILYQINSLEEELEEFNSIATETINAAYEYNDGVILSRNNIPMITKKETNNSTIVHKSSSKAYYYYSVEPMDILKRAGVDSSAGFIPSMQGRLARAAAKSGQDLRQEATLPSRSEIVSMYGNSSHIVGLERCEEFRDLVSPENRLMGPAGMFNSATNLLNKLLKLNCVNEQRLKQARTKGYRGGGNTGMLLQAPWGKHNPAPWRLHHLAAVGSKGVNQTEFLPVVMIKDPITWMASMCRHSYEARWRHVKEHCPNLVPNKYDRKRKLGEGTMGVQVKFATRHYGDEPLPDPHNKTFIRYDSLVHLWNTWYNQWYNVSFPRLIVRFEDLMLHAEETVSKVCECGGGTMQETFRYVEQSAKGQGGPHAGSAGFLASLVTYGNSTLRNKGILTDPHDVKFARSTLDKNLMETFGYAPI